MTDARPEYDARRYPCCAPWRGKKGPEFTRRFKLEFLGALHGYADDYATLHDHVTGEDPGGANGPAIAAANVAGARAHALRSKKLYSLLWQHVEDVDLRSELAAIVPVDGIQAWNLIVSRGSLPATGLTIVNEEQTWVSLKLADVGITEDTIVRFHGYINRVNADRQTPHAEHARWIKFLSAITFPSSLKDKASSELQRSSYLHAAGPNAGSPSLRDTVDAFDELWRLSYSRGEIKFIPPPRAPAPPTNRVDAMSAVVVGARGSSSIDEEFDTCFVAAADGKLESVCWNCWGLGHRRLDAQGLPSCPSTVKTRSIESAIKALQTLQALQRRKNGPGRGRGRGRGRARGFRPRAGRGANVCEFQNEAGGGASPVLDLDGFAIFAVECSDCDTEVDFDVMHVDTCAGQGAAVIDSGSRCHVTGDAALFPPGLIVNRQPGTHVKVASGARYPVAHVGTIVMHVEAVGADGAAGVVPLSLRGALYVPGLPADQVLISPRMLYDVEGVSTFFNDRNLLELPDGRRVHFEAGERNYLLPFSRGPAQHIDALKVRAYTNSRGPAPTADIVHARMAHFSHERIRASADCTAGLDLRAVSRPARCLPCERGGARKIAAQAGKTKRYTFFGECIASDTLAMPKSTPFGFIGVVCFKDMATAYIAIYFIRSHTSEEIRSCLKQFLADHARFLTRRGVVTWFTDNHGEFFSKDTDDFLAELLIRHKAISAHNPQMNASERVWGVLLRPIRIMLAAANVTEAAWPFAASQAARVHNSLLTYSAHVVRPGVSPYEMASGSVPNLSYFRVMFCECSCLVRSAADLQRMSKVAPRAVAGVHLGIDAIRGGYFVYVPEWARLTTFKQNEVRFLEDVFPTLRIIVGSYVTSDTRVTLPTEEQQQVDNMGAAQMPVPPPPPPPIVVALPAVPTPAPVSSRLRSSVAAVAVYNDAEALAVCVIDGAVLSVRLGNLEAEPLPPPPRTLKEAARTTEAAQWLQAATDEIAAKMRNETYVVVPRPPGRRVIKTRFVLTRKLHDDGSIKRHSARWVACGYSQIHGVDYHATFTATAKAASVRLFLGACAHLDLNTMVADVVKAFTTSDVAEELYVELPETFASGGQSADGRNKHVGKLRKALEGLKQAGNAFQADNVAHLKLCGFTQLEADPCLFLKIEGDKRIMLLIWVDDILIGYNSDPLLDRFLEAYRERYNITTGPLDRYIGIQITRDRSARTVTLTQEAYFIKIAEKFLKPSAMEKHTQLPAVASKTESAYDKLSTAADDAERAEMQELPYLSLVATVLYAAVMTRPDVAHHTSVLCRYMSDPSRRCYDALVTLANYLCSTPRLGITLGGEIRLPLFDSLSPPLDPALFLAQLGMYACSDASWKTGHTYCGHVVLIFNGAVDWGSKLLKVIAHSSAEAETAAACFAAKRQMFLLSVLRELDLKVPAGASLLIDNTAAKQLAEHMGVSKRTEHYLRWQHYVRHLVVHRHLKVYHLRTHEQPADALTKVLDKTSFLQARALILNEHGSAASATHESVRKFG